MNQIISPLAVDSPPAPLAPAGGRGGLRGRGVRAGFTLIEVVLALAITGLLLAGVFSVASSATTMAREVATSQERVMVSQSLLGLLRRTFEQVPGNASVELKLTGPGSGQSVFSDVVFRDFPMAFAWAGVEAGAKTVIFRTMQDPAGLMAARVLYLTEDQAEAYDNNRLREDDTVAGLTLLTGIGLCTWHFWDDRTEEWVDEWNPQRFANRRPSLVNLYFRFAGQDSMGENITFWIPTMANPSSYTNAAANRGGRPGGNQGGQGGGPGDGPGGPGGGPGAGPGGGGPGGGQPGLNRPGGGRGGGPPGGGGGRGGGGGGRGGPGGGGGGGRGPGGGPGIPGGGGR